MNGEWMVNEWAKTGKANVPGYRLHTVTGDRATGHAEWARLLYSGGWGEVAIGRNFCAKQG